MAEPPRPPLIRLQREPAPRRRGRAGRWLLLAGLAVAGIFLALRLGPGAAGSGSGPAPGGAVAREPVRAQRAQRFAAMLHQDPAYGDVTLRLEPVAGAPACVVAGTVPSADDLATLVRLLDGPLYDLGVPPVVRVRVAGDPPAAP